MQRLIRSFVYAWQGIRHCFAKEANFKIHAGIAAVTLLLSALLKISSLEWLVIAICIALVMGMEMLNTAIEHLCNLVYPGRSNHIKIIKDVAAAAVMVCAIAAAACGLIIFLPKILPLFRY
ncbi:MAG: diacylglycerol kinase family protein [Ferruginibacter sp.]